METTPRKKEKRSEKISLTISLRIRALAEVKAAQSRRTLNDYIRYVLEEACDNEQTPA